MLRTSLTYKLVSIAEDALGLGARLFKQLFGLDVHELRVLRLIDDEPGVTFTVLAGRTNLNVRRRHAFCPDWSEAAWYGGASMTKMPAGSAAGNSEGQSATTARRSAEPRTRSARVSAFARRRAPPIHGLCSRRDFRLGAWRFRW